MPYSRHTTARPLRRCGRSVWQRAGSGAASSANAAGRSHITAPATCTATSLMADTSTLLYLLQVASGSFPVGSFSHSYGLETLIQDGRITDARGLTDIAHLWLRYGVATSEGGAVGVAFRATRENDFTKVAELDEVLTALKLTRETREASI